MVFILFKQQNYCNETKAWLPWRFLFRRQVETKPFILKGKKIQIKEQQQKHFLTEQKKKIYIQKFRKNKVGRQEKRNGKQSSFFQKRTVGIREGKKKMM